MAKDDKAGKGKGKSAKRAKSTAAVVPVRAAGKGLKLVDAKAEKLSGKDYDKALRDMHVELVKLQEWVKHAGLKVCIVFEGRDAAGKGGAIKAITERVSPRVFRVVALPAPTDREIKITSIKPDGGTLKTGETVKLAISAAYTLPAQGGGVGIVVQDSKNALIANKLTQVAGGSGTVAEEVEFKVPATERIVVHVPLYLKDETKSSTVASREFKVTAK